MALLHVNIPVSETFFLAVSNGSVTVLKEIVAEIGPEVAAEVVKSLNSKGETPLLLAIKGQHFEMVKFLVQNLKADIGQLGLSWNGLDCMKVPPLFAAMIFHHDYSGIIDYLMRADATNESFIVLNSIKSSNLPLQDKIDLMKFVGAAYILKDSYPTENLTFGKKFWYEAMALRSTTAIAEMPTQLFSEWARNVRGVLEFTTMEELEEMDESAIFWYHSIRMFKFQALLVVDRVGSRFFRDAPHPYFLRQLIEHEYASSLNENPTLRLDMLMLALELLRDEEWELVINSEWAREIVCDTFVYIVEVAFNVSSYMPPNDPTKLTFVRFMEVLRCFSALHCKLLQRPVTKVSRFAKEIIKNMVKLFDEMPQLNLDETQRKDFEQWLSNYIADINGHSGVLTLLHAACDSQIQFIPLLLAAGADPVATDVKGWAPLHFLLNPRTQHKEGISAFVQLILNAGAHMDQLNSRGQTPLDFYKSLEQRPDPQLDAIVSKILPFSLRCFCTQVICKNKIPFQRALPPALQNFVGKHDAKI